MKALYLAAALLLSSACSNFARSPALPEPITQRSLVRDLARIVDSREQLTWRVDDIDVELAIHDAMASVCAVAAEQRAEALVWLDHAIAENGGDDLKAAWLAADKDLDAINDLLLLQRTRMLFQKADEMARAGKCLFYIEEEDPFLGIQTDAEKWILGIETGGRAVSQIIGGKIGFGGGGAFRILFGKGISEEFSLLVGLELGGSARFSGIRYGERANLPELVFVQALPIIFRRTYLSDYLDFEIGPMNYINQVSKAVQPGIRTGASIGVSRIRLRGILPAVAFGVTYDFAPARDEFPNTQIIAAGVRAAFSISP